MSKTVEKMADRGTHVRSKETRPSTENDVIVQISKNRNLNWTAIMYSPFFGLTHVFYLKPISVIVFK